MKAIPVETQIDEFVSEYSAEMQAQLREARKRLRGRFARGYELVFDNYNALVFGISPTDRARESFISIAGYPRWVTLFFLHGATLPDPAGLLEGTGKQVRGIRLATPSQLATPAIEALIAEAARPHAASLAAAPPLSTVVRMAVARRRSRRPAGA